MVIICNEWLLIATSGCQLQRVVANCNEWLLIAMSGCVATSGRVFFNVCIGIDVESWGKRTIPLYIFEVDPLSKTSRNHDGETSRAFYF